MCHGRSALLLLIVALGSALVAAALHRRVVGWLRFTIHGAALATLLLSLALAPSVTVVEKLATRLIVPTGLVWGAGFVLCWFLLLRGRGRAAALSISLWCLYSLAGNEWLGQGLVHWLERDLQPPPATARFDAVAVLGGGTDVTPWGEPQLSFSGDRVRVGATLYARGQTERLICSGSSIPGLSQRGTRNLAEETAGLWVEMGVPRHAIVEIPDPINTSTEIEALADLVRERGWQRVGLVTSAWHLRRALRLAERRGLRVTPIPADVRGRPRPLSIVGVVPSGSGFYTVQIAWKEIVGALVGR